MNRVPSYGARYVLDPEDMEKGSLSTRPHELGYDRHDETCPAKVRDRERRERKL